MNVTSQALPPARTFSATAASSGPCDLLELVAEVTVGPVRDEPARSGNREATCVNRKVKSGTLVASRRAAMICSSVATPETSVSNPVTSSRTSFLRTELRNASNWCASCSAS